LQGAAAVAVVAVVDCGVFAASVGAQQMEAITENKANFFSMREILR